MRALVAFMMAVLLTGGAALGTVAAQDDSRTDADSALERAGSVLIEGNRQERTRAAGAQVLERAGSRLSGSALERAAANQAASLERADAAVPVALERAGARLRGLSPDGLGVSAEVAAGALERASTRFTGANSTQTASFAVRASERAGAQILVSTFSRSGGANVESVLERASAGFNTNEGDPEEEELQTLERSGSRLRALRPTAGITDASNASERAGATLTAITLGRSGALVAVQALERGSVTEQSRGSAAPVWLPANAQGRLSGLTPVTTERAQERAVAQVDAGARAVTEAGARLNGLDPRQSAGTDAAVMLERANATLETTSQERAVVLGASQALAQAGARLSEISPEADAS